MPVGSGMRTCATSRDGDHVPCSLVAPLVEYNPAPPPIEDVFDRGNDRGGASALRRPAFAFEERHWHFANSCPAPPHLEQALRVGERALRFELDGLDETARVHRHVLVVPKRKSEQEPN